MKRAWQIARAGLARFWRGRDREAGSMTVEAVLMMPLLLWVFGGSWVFFDAYRAKSINTRAAYTVGDVLSRESGYITPTFVNSISALQGVLMPESRAPRIRVSVFTFDAPTNSYRVRWSTARGTGVSALTDAALNEVRAELPDMPNLEVATLVETWTDYTPIFDVGLAPFTFEDRVVTRLRFAGQLCYSVTGTVSDALC
jgi:hypothetical protein